MRLIKYSLGIVTLVPVTFLLWQSQNPLGLQSQINVISFLLMDSADAITSFDQIEFAFSLLPRTCLALLIGAALGLTGSVLQQITQNPLVSPLTLGTSSGAWLALVCMTIGWPMASMAIYGHWVALLGGILASASVILIAGRNGISGLPIVLAGMAVHMFLGALAVTIVLLNDQSVRILFIWGAGDLTQSDWFWVKWLLPKLSIVFFLPLFCFRSLTLMKLGDTNAQARGMSLKWTLCLIILFSLWGVSASITAVGVIGFVALMAPNIARALGVRSSFHEMWSSALIGAWVLLLMDGVAQWASQWTLNLVPSGIAVALLGAPYLLLLMKQGRIKDNQSINTTINIDRSVTPFKLITFLLTLLLIVALSAFYSPTLSQLSWPSDDQWQWRWPRMLGAFSAGAGMAVAGMVLQTLIRNPLASPDILGLSAGASLSLILVSMVTGASVHEVGPFVAFVGSLMTLGLLIILGRKHQYNPAFMVLLGIGLMAMLDAVINFSLAKGGPEVFGIIGWMSGSTYHMQPNRALVLTAITAILVLLVILLHPWLKLLSLPDDVAQARGLNTSTSRLCLMVIAAIICAFCTSLLGPIAFVGLVAPHAARLLGARTVKMHIVFSCGLGGSFLLAANWLGQVALFPTQIPAGALASLIGGAYFLILLSRRKGLLSV